MRSEANAALVERAVHGDKAAFATLYDLYVHRVYAYCLLATHHHEDAEDLLALTFEQALCAIGRYSDRGLPFSSWLLRIAANTIAQRARRDRLERAILMENGARWRDDAAGFGDASLDTHVERWEAAHERQEQIATLAHDQAAVLWMRYWDDLSPADIAVRLGRTEQATRKLLFRAITTLRARLANDEGLGDDDEARGLGDARGRRQRTDGAQTGRPRAAHA